MQGSASCDVYKTTTQSDGSKCGVSCWTVLVDFWNSLLHKRWGIWNYNIILLGDLPQCCHWITYIGQEVHVHLRVWYILCAVFSSPNPPSFPSTLPSSPPPLSPFLFPPLSHFSLPPPPHTHSFVSSTCCVVWLKSMWTTGESIQSTLMDTVLMTMPLSGSGRYSGESVSTLFNQTCDPSLDYVQHNSTLTVLYVHLQCACGISL